MKPNMLRQDPASRCPCHRHGAFTLIEVLVVVAIIALLVAILLPSLARVRATAMMVQCQSNARQLATAFLMYSVENRHRLPGMCTDADADWLGSGNITPPKSGRNPQDGVIFKYLGRNMHVYGCPDDTSRPISQGAWYRSYSATFVLDGAKPELLLYSHYRLSPRRNESTDFSISDHAASMRRLGVPLIVEEDPQYCLRTNDEGGWSNCDGVTDRHLKTGRTGYGTVAYVDGSAGRVDLPPQKSGPLANPGDVRYFNVNSLCLRVGRTWVSTQIRTQYKYGMLNDNPPSAESIGIKH